jgi:hypothetical protein
MTLVRRRPPLLVSRMYGLTAALRRQNRPLSLIQRPLGLVQRAGVLPAAHPARSPSSWRPTRMVWTGHSLTVGTEAPMADEAADWEWAPGLESAHTQVAGEETIVQRSEAAPSPSPPPSVPRVLAQRPAPPGYSIRAEAEPSASPQPALEEEPSAIEDAAGGLVRGSDLWRRMFPERPRLRDVIQAREAAKQKKAARRTAPPTIPDNLPRTRTWEISTSQPGQPAVSRAPASPPPERPDESVEDSAESSQVPVAEEEGPEEAPTQRPLPPPAERPAAAGPSVQTREPTLPSGPTPTAPAARSPRRKPAKPEDTITEPSEVPGAVPSSGDAPTTEAAVPVQRTAATPEPEPSHTVTAEAGSAGDETPSEAAPAAEPPVTPIQRDDSVAKEAPVRRKTPPLSTAARQPSAPAEPVGAEPSLPPLEPTVTVPTPSRETEGPAATPSREAEGPATTSDRALALGPESRPGPIQKQPAPSAELPETPPDRASGQPQSPPVQPLGRVTADHPPTPTADQPDAHRPTKTAPTSQDRSPSGEPSARPRSDVTAPPEPSLGPPPAPTQLPDEGARRPATEYPTISTAPVPGIAREAAEASADEGETERPTAAEPSVERVRPESTDSLGVTPSRPTKPSGRQRVQARRQVLAATDTSHGAPTVPGARPGAEPPTDVSEPQSPPAAVPSQQQAPRPDLSPSKPIHRSVVRSPAGPEAAEREPGAEPVRVEPIPRPRPAVGTPDTPAKPPVVPVSEPRATTDGTAGPSPTGRAADSGIGRLRVAPVQRVMHHRAGAGLASGTVQPGSMLTERRVDRSVPVKSETHPMPLPRVPASGPSVARHVRASESGDRPEPSPWWSGVSAQPAPSLPLHIPARPASAPVQRTEAVQDGAESPSAEGTSVSAEEPAGAQGPDLEELARQVFPYLRRRLSVERERSGRG